MNNKLISIGKAAKMLGVSIDTLRRWDKSGKLVATRLSPTGNRFYAKADIDILLGNPLVLAKQWVAGADPELPQTNFYCKTRDVFQARLESLQDKIAKSLTIALSSLITAVAGEIGNNSFDHNLGNWPDMPGIFFTATAGKKIVLADRGQGVLATLRKVKPDLKSHSDALFVAFTQTISARSQEARGNGLKFVKSIVTTHPIKLSFQTGNAFLNLSKKESSVDVNTINESIRGTYVVIEY